MLGVVLVSSVHEEQQLGKLEVLESEELKLENN